MVWHGVDSPRCTAPWFGWWKRSQTKIAWGQRPRLGRGTTLGWRQPSTEWGVPLLPYVAVTPQTRGRIIFYHGVAPCQTTIVRGQGQWSKCWDANELGSLPASTHPSGIEPLHKAYKPPKWQNGHPQNAAKWPLETKLLLLQIA